MYTFLKVFTNMLASHGIIPPEADNETADQENRTFWQNFPDEASNVGNCYLVKEYNSMGDSFKNKETIVRNIQLVVRNYSQIAAIEASTTIYTFLHNRPEIIEDLTWEDEKGTHTGYVIIKCNNGPQKLEEDKQGRYRYSVSCAITTNII